MDLRKDKFFSMQDSRYSLSSIIILVTCSVSPTHLKVAEKPSLTLTRSIFIAIWSMCCGVTPLLSLWRISLVAIINGATFTLVLKVLACPKYMLGNNSSLECSSYIMPRGLLF
jgi:hypothetical protein